MLRKSALAAAVAVAALCQISTPNVAQAQTVYCTNCASQWTQVLQQAQQAQQLTNQISQLATQVQQYQQMLKDGLALPDQVFGQAMRDIGQINNLIEQSKGLAYTAANLDEQFKQRYGNLDSYMQSGMSQQQLQQKYRQWSDETNSTAQTAMRALGAHASSMQNDQAFLQRMQSRAGSAQGQMQAISVGNELAIEGLAQMQKLQQLVMMQVQMQAQVMQTEEDRRAVNEASARTFFGSYNPQYTGNTY